MSIGFRCEGDFACSKEEMREQLLNVITNLELGQGTNRTWVHGAEQFFHVVAGLETSLYVDTVVNASCNEDTLEVAPFFVYPPVRFFLRDHRLTIEVNSSSTGPGYHVALLRIFEQLEKNTSVHWDRSTLHDDTGYYIHRNFPRLQAFMRDWLAEFNQELSASSDRPLPIRTNLTMPYAMLPQGDDCFVCHATGYISRDLFTYVLSQEDQELICRAFFIWWEEDWGPEFYLKCALNLIWCHINWLPPELDHEFVQFEQALKSLERAWEERKDLTFPVPEWIELAVLTRNRELVQELILRFPLETSQPPTKGYRRYDVLHTLGENKWRIALPGKMHKFLNEEGIFFWDNQQRAIRISTSHSLDDQGQPLSATTLAQTRARYSKAIWHSLPLAPAVPAYILHETVEGSGQDKFRTILFAAQDGHLAVISMEYPRAEQQLWALAVCNSLVAL